MAQASSKRVRAAEMLGISRKSLWEKLRLHGISDAETVNLVGGLQTADIAVAAPLFGPSFNRYSYALNNPLRITDPTGNEPYYGPNTENDGGPVSIHVAPPKAAGPKNPSTHPSSPKGGSQAPHTQPAAAPKADDQATAPPAVTSSPPNAEAPRSQGASVLDAAKDFFAGVLFGNITGVTPGGFLFNLSGADKGFPPYYQAGKGIGEIPST